MEVFPKWIYEIEFVILLSEELIQGNRWPHCTLNSQNKVMDKRKQLHMWILEFVLLQGMLLQPNRDTIIQLTVILTLIIHINEEKLINNTFKIFLHLNILTSTLFLWYSAYSSSVPLDPEVEPFAFPGKLSCS